MHKKKTLAVCIAVAVCAFACTPAQQFFEAGKPCATRLFTVDDDFTGARRGACEVLSRRAVRLTIVPEDAAPINDSAWYAFRLTPRRPTAARVTLRYEDGHHRYLPKMSVDGRSWQAVPSESVEVDESGLMATLQLQLDGQPVWISGQELLTPDLIDAWADDLAARTGVARRRLGESAAARPIFALTANGAARDVVLLVGRQHPPEVTGTVGMRAFTDALFADTALARSFHARFSIVMVPLMNPDGVVRGHWRNNLGGVDLNRDWGPFTQPETRLVRDLIDGLEADGKRIRLFLDFHSTKRNVFYTQSDADVTDPADFATRWLAAARPRIENYPFEQAQRHNEGKPTAKNYMYSRFGIPAITYEVGDETDRGDAAAAAGVFAEEMMRLMLEAHE